MKWLRNKRKAKGLTQRQVAEQCGFSPQLYGHIETGRRQPRVTVAKKIAKVLEFDWTLFY